MNLSQIKIYRILHIENIPHILENGITHKNSPSANSDFVGIGDVSLIDNRNTRRVHVDNGNTFNTIETITLGDFTPFYFGVKMPMLYVIQQGGNFVEKANKPEDIIYVACSIESIINSDLIYYFSDGHATDFLTTFYNKDRVDQLPLIVDWPSVKMPYWGGQENLDIKRKKQAEFLVQGDIPPDFIIGFGCYNDSAKQKLMEFGIDKELVKVIPNAYY
ncbi:DUF4433 domain-containing protein [Fulvivirga ulvae]|uniref:DUF4433 domain-containing protein n=1 Tax=Fulvivirga ulvae TaxID=2904245 RepID=UPI001F164398|nr:DUF4433 domain-containing protein [Fulvivirga ulvae]UII32695.1 DUF4433 domain-containing protein [Fulvivirga ulvae]